jgi:hypothetical protein
VADLWIAFISDEIHHGLDYGFPADIALNFGRRRRHQFFADISAWPAG